MGSPVQGIQVSGFSAREMEDAHRLDGLRQLIGKGFR
jgi:hypothetical protein